MPSHISFENLLKDPQLAETYIQGKFDGLVAVGFIAWLKSQLTQTQEHASQGLVFTGYEGEGIHKPAVWDMPADAVEQTILAWLYYLDLFNHPERLVALFKQSESAFLAPGSSQNQIFSQALSRRQAINIADLKLEAGGTDKKRRSRTKLHATGPFVSYQHQVGEGGRAQARNLLVGGANPDIFGSAMAIATLAQTHSLVALPRDGFFSRVSNQVGLAHEVFAWLERSPVFVGKTSEEQAKLLEFYQHNVVGVLEANPQKVLIRAQALYEAGIRTFRIYSPEPGSDALDTLQMIRAWQKADGLEPIEVFVGQVIDATQAIALQNAGADALYVGIGGGGRCITGVVGGLTINWPQLVWELRGKLDIPIIVEGGANDYINETVAVGASGIGAVGKFGGTIETPGGIQFFIDNNGEIFKYYGGETSDRMRAMAGRHAPFGAMLNTEGETTRKEYRNGNANLPTMLQVLHQMQQGIVAGMVFQNVGSIYEMQTIGAERLVLASPNDDKSRSTHNR